MFEEEVFEEEVFEEEVFEEEARQSIRERGKVMRQRGYVLDCKS